MNYMNHEEPYSETYLQDILSSVKTIAMVGASGDKTKFSYGVLDMVEVFRNASELPRIAQEAVAISAKVLWGQIGVTHPDAAKIAEDAGLKVVMNRCPKIELFRPFWKPKLHLTI